MAKTPGFGVDIGGSGIKGCTVDLMRGALDDERIRIPTPESATPAEVAEVVATVTREFGWHGAMGITLPSVLKDGVALTAANIDPSWVGTDAAGLFSRECSVPVTVLNDADAAGLAEMRFGAGREHDGVVLLLTFGTGIGSALFLNGELVPNTELGHLEVDGIEGERRAAAAAREIESLAWDQWAARVSRYLQVLENLLWPDLIIVGGGVSRRAAKWLPYVECRSPVVPAALRNDAGIVGAAAAAAEGRVD